MNMNFKKFVVIILLSLFFFRFLFGEGNNVVRSEASDFWGKLYFSNAGNYPAVAIANRMDSKWIGCSRYSISPKSKRENSENIPTRYRIGIGSNSNFLLLSDIFKKGFSGFGVFVEFYFTEYLALKFEFDRWMITSKKEEPENTPFKQASVWKKNSMLKINIDPRDRVLFLQFGFVSTSKEVGYERRGGITYGIGCRLLDDKNVNLFLVFRRNIFGQFSVGGSDLWDKDSELGLEFTYRIRRINN